ncbi:MAG: SufE family protein [Nitriliruptoraceae bacterium]
MSLPANLENVVNEFAAAPMELRIELLVEYSDKVPPLPARLADHPEELEQVEECQTPFFLTTEVDEDGRVTVWFDSPPESPTTRGFAGILSEGLNGATVDEVLAVPRDFHHDLGLAEAISPLRLQGMDAILTRLKRQVATHRSDRVG